MLTNRSSGRVKARVNIRKKQIIVVVNPQRADSVKKFIEDFLKNYQQGIVSESNLKRIAGSVFLVIKDIDSEVKKVL